MNVTWNLQIETGASNPTWNSRTIFGAFTRVTRYWNVSFQQVSKSPVMPIVLRRSLSYPMSVTGRTINVNSKYRWVNQDQALLALVHELGHWFSGNKNHAPQNGANVMQPTLGDPYINFSQVDAQWFSKLKWRSSLLPWTEPNHWRPMRADDSMEQPYELIHLPCNHSWCDTIFSMFNRTTQEWV